MSQLPLLQKESVIAGLLTIGSIMIMVCQQFWHFVSNNDTFFKPEGRFLLLQPTMGSTPIFNEILCVQKGTLQGLYACRYYKNSKLNMHIYGIKERAPILLCIEKFPTKKPCPCGCHVPQYWVQHLCTQKS